MRTRQKTDLEARQFRSHLSVFMALGGWSKSALARKLGIKRQSMEDVFEFPTDRQAKRLGQALGVPARWFWDGDLFANNTSETIYRRVRKNPEKGKKKY